MKISRLYQPRKPEFWLMVILNGLSASLGWVSHAYPLTGFGSLLVTVFAVGNAMLGLYLAWRLLSHADANR